MRSRQSEFLSCLEDPNLHLDDCNARHDFDHLRMTLSNECSICLGWGMPDIAPCLSEGVSAEGPSSGTCDLYGDVDGSGVVDIADLLLVLSAFNVHC
eukprot:SAG31_NODE_7370_length_1707_cov_2.820896_1_plen_97_part_00